MRDTTVKLLDGRTLCAPIWEWRPQAGWFTLAGHDERIYFYDVECAVTPQAEGSPVRDELERAKNDGYDPEVYQAIPVYGAPPFIAVPASPTDNFGTTHTIHLVGYTDLKRGIETMRTIPAFKVLPIYLVADMLKNPEGILLDEFYDWTINTEDLAKAQARVVELEAGGLKVQLRSVQERHDPDVTPLGIGGVVG